MLAGIFFRNFKSRIDLIYTILLKRRRVMSRIGCLLVLASLSLLCFTSNSIAQDAGQPGEFLRYGVGARALGMGRAFVAVTNDASAVFWNPAGLISLQTTRWGAMGMHTKLYEGAEYHCLSGALHIRHGFVIGAGWLSLSMGGFEERNQYNVPTGRKFSDSQSSLSFSLANGWEIYGHKIGVGLTSKYIQHNLFNEQGEDWGYDFGLKYTPSFGWISIGFARHNFNAPNIKLGNGGDDIIPSTGKIGISISSPWLTRRYLRGFLISFDYDAVAPHGRKNGWYTGIEYDWSVSPLGRLPFKTRLGFNSSQENFAFGASLNYFFNLPEVSSGFRIPPSLMTNFDWTGSDHPDFGSSAERMSVTLSGALTAGQWYELKKKVHNPIMHSNCRACHENGTKRFEMAVQPATAPDPEGNYKVAAWLRLGDIKVQEATDKMQGLQKAVDFYYAANKEEGSETKREVDSVLNRTSFLYYIQGLLYKGKIEKDKDKIEEAIKTCDLDMIWTNHRCEKNENAVRYLEACALYEKGDRDHAQRILSALDTLNYAPATFMLGKLYKKEHSWQESRSLFEKLNKQRAKKPPAILYPEDLADCSLLDDAQYYLGECYEKMGKKEEAKSEYIKVIIHYPLSRRIIDAKTNLDKVENQ